MLRYLQRSDQNPSSALFLYIFLGLWLLINLIQGAFTGLHPDEAYYWIYSKFMDWGYFDHPPMVALYIKAGDVLMHSPLGLRLMTILTNTCAIVVLWKIVRPYANNLRLFLLLFSSVLIFHVYGFITTPDSPLYLFSILFLYAYQQYLKADKIGWAILIGILAAALLLSKYHGILVILFILLSNLKLFTRPSFWLAILIALLLFAPHVYWQFLNGFPSIKYHLFERSASPYKFEYTIQFFLDQLLMMGPLMGWFLIFKAWKLETQADHFLKGLKFLCYGVLIFFFLNTFKGRVQAHWPLIEFIPLFILAYISIAQKGLKPLYKNIFIINIVLILMARSILMFSPPALQQIKFVNSYFGYDIWANTIQKATQGRAVIFQDGFQQASYFNYYNNTLNGFAYNSFYYRKTQYDIWSIEDSLHHKPVWYILDHPHHIASGQIIIPTLKGNFYAKPIEQATLYQKLHFKPVNIQEVWKKGQKIKVNFLVENPYEHDVDFSGKNSGEAVKVLYGYYQNGQVIQVAVDTTINKNTIIPAKGQVSISLQIQAPEQSGTYKLFIAVQTVPFPGSRNSDMINMIVK